MRTGAKLKLTPELQEKICNKIKLGCTKRFAAVSSGICEGSLYGWLKKAEKSKSGIYFEFLKAIKRAEADAVAAYEVELRKIAHAGNVTAVIYYLQNRAPDEWKDKRVMEHSGPDRGPITIRVEYADEEKVDAKQP